MNADNELLASAYLDGELTDDERSIAESDPAVMAQVEQLRALRVELADVEPASADARERALAAAMGAFEEVHGAAPTPSPVVDISRRRDQMRWLGAAAAVVVVGLLGVVVAAGLGGGEDDSASDSADELTNLSASAVADEPASDFALVPDPADDADDADAADGTDRLTESAVADDAEAEMAVADEAASEPAEGAGDAPADMADDAAGAATSVPAALELPDPEEYLDGRPITIPEELRWVARHLLDLLDRRELPPTPNHSCPFPDVLSRGVLLDGDAEVEVYIAVTPEARTVLAIDQETCRILLDVELQP